MTDGTSVSPEITGISNSLQKTYPLPTEMLTRGQRLDQDQHAVVQGQWNLFNELRGASQSANPLRERQRAGRPILAKGTLTHGSGYSRDYVTKIKATGILSGEFVGVPEDGETHYCADFFKVPEDTSVAGYMKWCREMWNEGIVRNVKRPERTYLPTPGSNADRIAFIVDVADPRLTPLLKHDAYNPDDQEVMSKIVNHLPAVLGSTKAATVSAVLVGVPSNFINGAIVGDDIPDEDRRFLKETFGDNFMLFSTSGEEITIDDNTPS